MANEIFLARMENIIRASNPTLAKKLEESGKLKTTQQKIQEYKETQAEKTKKTTVPETKISIPNPFIGGLVSIPFSPTVTIAEHTAGETPTATVGAEFQSGLIDNLTPTTPSVNQAVVTPSPLGVTTEYGAGVTEEQKQLVEEEIVSPVTNAVSQVSPVSGVGNILGSIGDAGKWILIGGAVLLGALVLSRRR